jgi:signal transduction histidine kinase
MESATPFFIDMAVMRPEKVARLVALTSKRRELEFEMARERALAELRSELKSDLTGLLISSELALDAAGVTMPVVEKLHAVLEIARRMQSRLEGKTD